MVVTAFYDVVAARGLWTPSPCYSNAAAAPVGPAPGDIRIGVCNVNGVKTKAAKRARIGSLHEGGETTAAHDMLFLCELGNKAQGSTKLSTEDCHSIVTDITPYGRGWITPYTAITTTAVMNGVDIQVAYAEGGRVTRADYEWGRQPVSNIVVYAPSDAALRVQFMHRVMHLLPAVRMIFMGGDFNCVPNPTVDSRHRAVDYKNRGMAEWRVAQDALQLIDLAPACSGPEEPQGWFTFLGQGAGNDYERHLDQIYVTSGMLERVDVASFRTQPSGIAGVDHSLMSVRIQVAPTPEQDLDKVFPGMALDVVFAGDFVDQVEHLLAQAYEKRPEEDDSIGWNAKVDEVTRSVQGLYCDHRKAALKARSTEATTTLRRLEMLQQAAWEQDQTDYFSTKRRLVREHVQACERRSEILSTNEDIGQREWRERATHSYSKNVQPRSASGVFHTQEQVVPELRPEQTLEFIMGSLGDDRGWVRGSRPPEPVLEVAPGSPRLPFTSRDDIVANTAVFWAAQYKRFASHIGCQRHVLERLAACTRTVPPDHMALLARLLTVDEMVTAILSLKTGKVSGTNGIPAELYSACALGWARLLTAQANACYLARTELSELQRRGRIAQLYKKGLRSMCENMRPVATLNKDYQSISMCLSNRWRDAAAVLTGFDQTGFVADRFMDWNIRKFLDGMYYAREMNIDCALVLFDFKKAYDNVSLAFLFAILDIMCGVPLELVWEDLQGAQACPPGEYVYKHSAPPTCWIQTLYKNHLRTVSVNGTTTIWFMLESSVPQGDCLAPTAFILYIEALGILLRTNPNIEGIRLPSGDTLVATRFADDTGSLVTPPSLPYVMTDVEVFSAASGMVNHTIKTQGAWAGALWQKPDPWHEAAFLGDLTVDGGKPRLTWLPPGFTMGLLARCTAWLRSRRVDRVEQNRRVNAGGYVYVECGAFEHTCAR